MAGPMAPRGLTAALLCIALLFGASSGAAEQAPLRFAAIGDLPYGGGDQLARFARLIETINAEAPDFSVHVGDIKSGQSLCSDGAFYRIAALFGHFDGPLVYIPGDNEWTDCHREMAGRFEPLERLARLREIFFAGAFQYGAPGAVHAAQSDTADFESNVENLRWEAVGVAFATLHIVGSFDNARRDPAEFAARRAAALAWLDGAFERAAAIDARALVLFFHADPFFERYPPGHADYRGVLDTLAGLASAFGRPVLLVHGDSHRFIIDTPLAGPAGAPLENVVRIEVWGPGAMRAVVISIAPGAPAQFRFDVLAIAREPGAAKSGEGPGGRNRWSAAHFGFPAVLP